MVTKPVPSNAPESCRSPEHPILLCRCADALQLFLQDHGRLCADAAVFPPRYRLELRFRSGGHADVNLLYLVVFRHTQSLCIYLLFGAFLPLCANNIFLYLGIVNNYGDI